MSGGLRLNLGSGACLIDGYRNIDIKEGGEAYPLDITDESVDEIRASHLLEHFPHSVTMDVLADWRAKLKPGGCMKIAVPDFRKMAALYVSGVPLNVQGYVYGGQDDASDFHRALFDESRLREMMAKVGLERIGEWKSEQQDCAALPISLNLMGYRPLTDDHFDLSTIRAVLASARFGPALHHRCAYGALMGLRIDYRTVIGCFWHQILSEAIEKTIANATCEYVLTCDFDTIFTQSDVLELARLMRAYPDAGAICALQSKRGCESPLMGNRNSDGTAAAIGWYDRNQLLSPVDSGHFGLTLFRAEKLRAMPRPWMCPKPNPRNGRWDDGCIDADIDFWLNWRDAGNSLHVANQIVVGHMEELVTWPGVQFAPVHQKAEDYIEHGIPSEIGR